MEDVDEGVHILLLIYEILVDFFVLSNKETDIADGDNDDEGENEGTQCTYYGRKYAR